MARLMSVATFLNLPSIWRVAIATMMGMVAFLIWDQSHWWGLREDYYFGYLVPVFAAYVLWDRMPRLQRLTGWSPPADHLTNDQSAGGPSTPNHEAPGEAGSDRSGWETVFSAIFLAGLGLGLISFLFGAVYRAAEGAAPTASMPITAGFSSVLLGIVWLVMDRDREGRRISFANRRQIVGLFIFPALIWLLSAPMFGTLERSISTFLLNKVTIIVFSVFDILNFPLIREGSVLILPDHSRVGVEDACSGIRSLTACLFAGSFLAAIFLDRWWMKILLVACAMGLAFFNNILRSLFLTTWAYRNGADSIGGTVHDATGYAVLGLTMIGLFLLLPIFNFRLEYDPPPPKTPTPNSV